MTISFHKSDFFNQLFPDVDLTIDEAVKEKIKSFYFPNHVKVTIDGDKIVVEILESVETKKPQDFFRATELCAKKRYNEAIPIFFELIKKNPTDSEYHRNLAQAYEESGDFEKATNHLIESLRWNPANSSALILMGNIYFRYHDDLKTAMTFFDQVIESDPKNFIALNNIGGLFLQKGKLNVAKRFFDLAYKVNPDYPNTTLGLGLVNFQNGDFKSSFDYSISIIKKVTTEDQVYHRSLQLALDSASALIKQQTGKESLVDFIQEVESLTGKEVRIEEDQSINTAAKVEFAESHGRTFHLIRTNPKYPNTDHLIAHELVHLKLAEEARMAGENKLFIGKEEKIEEFKSIIKETLKKLKSRGLPDESIAKYSKDLFHGILAQVFNTPIDLFIEDYLYNHFPDLRPVQFISLFQLNQEAHKAVNDPKILEISPSDIVSKSRVFNVLSARHYEDLYGVKMEKQYAIKSFELKQINSFWEEFLEYRADKQAGEEYELIQHWGEDLGLDHYFKLIDEQTDRLEKTKTKKAPEEILSQIELDPFQNQSLYDFEEAELKVFQKQHSGKDLNMAVAMYMVGALDYFKKITITQVKEIAIEIAMLGRSGINPEKKGYRLNKIPNTTFSGYKLLAYYYVSWAIAIPEMLKELQMPFEKEFELAKKLSV